MSSMEELFGEVIHSYTRAQALEDGALVDVSDTAREAGFRYPMALTAAAWAECVAWDHGGTQDEVGRLWDVVWMAWCAVRRTPATTGSRLLYSLRRVPNRAGKRHATLVGLVLHFGPGDSAEPVLTVMLPGED